MTLPLTFLAAEVASGDWIDLASLTFTAQDGRKAELHVSRNWAKPRNFSQRFAGFDAKEKFVPADASRPRRYADPGRELEYEEYKGHKLDRKLLELLQRY